MLIVDGKVKSGKSVVARYVVPHFAASYDLFKAAVAVYVDLLALFDMHSKIGIREIVPFIYYFYLFYKIILFLCLILNY